MKKLSRAAFVSGTAAAAAVPFVGTRNASADFFPYTRYNIYNVIGRCSLHPILAGYETAVSAMLALSPSDPRSWIYQASIHGTTAAQILPDWNTCQHGSYFFFSWHRMYLYWFERIVRKFSRVYGFALPYWNYSNGLQPGNTENVLPPPFADPRTSLYTANRNTGVNSGSGLPASAIAVSASLSDLSFSTGGLLSLGFGGGPPTPDVPTQFSTYTGDLEQQPHNVVHDAVGGLMGDITTAAQDPIFYLHHANIDRLWDIWIASGGGRRNPTDSPWLNTTFTFFDENANPRVMTGRQITSTRALGYEYNESGPPTTKCPPLILPVKPSPSLDSVLSREASPEMPMVGPIAGHGVQLRTTRVDVSIGPSFPHWSATKRALLRFSGISYDHAPGYYYEIYLNLPENASPAALSQCFVGNLSFFGAWVHENGKMANKPETFDISRIVQSQIASGSWKFDAAKVTLIRQGAKDAMREQFALRANTRLDSVQIID